MTHYRLTSDGLVPHTVDGDAYRKYFANQAAGIPQLNTIPIKEGKKKKSKVVVKLVSDVQDAVDRAKAEIKHIKTGTAENVSQPLSVKVSTSSARHVKKKRITRNKPTVRGQNRRTRESKVSRKNPKFASRFVHRE